MPYIGVQPSTSFQTLAKQDFTTSATTSYTLSQSVSSANDIALFINNVRQEPTYAYSASGTALTLTAATTSSDDMYCVYLGRAVGTINPASGSVGVGELSATGTKDSTTFLRGDNTFAEPSSDNFYSEMLHVTEEAAYNTAGTTANSAGNYLKLGLNTVKRNAITSATLSSSVISLPAGTYYCEGHVTAYDTNYTQTRLRDTTNSTTVVLGSGVRVGSNETENTPIRGSFTLSGTANLEFQAVSSGTSTHGFGYPSTTGDSSEGSVYSQLMIIKVA